jgi:hypothetical protein
MSILTFSAPVVNFEFAATDAPTPEAAEPRPSYDFSYYPDLEEERDAREMFDDADDEGPTDAEWDAMAADAMNLEMACSGHWAF